MGDVFRKVVSPYPTKHASKYAEAFISQLNGVDRALLSDLWTPDFQHVVEHACFSSGAIDAWHSRLPSPMTPSKTGKKIKRQLTLFKHEAHSVVTCFPPNT